MNTFEYSSLFILINKINQINEDEEKYKRIIIPLSNNTNTINSSNDMNNNKKSSVFKLITVDLNSETQEKEKEKENERLNEKIKDYIRKLLMSQLPSEMEIKNSNSLTQSKIGRKMFANFIYQEKFNTNKYHQLSEKSFDLLTQLISNALIQAEYVDDQLIDIIKISKSCFFYYKFIDSSSKKSYFIYKELVKNQIRLWEDYSLWKKWFIIEINQGNIIGNMNIKSNNSSDNTISTVKSNESSEDMLLLIKSPDDFYFSKILFLFNFMKDFNLDRGFIHSVIERIGVDYIKNESSRKEILKVIDKQIKYGSSFIEKKK